MMERAPGLQKSFTVEQSDGKGQITVIFTLRFVLIVLLVVSCLAPASASNGHRGMGPTMTGDGLTATMRANGLTGESQEPRSALLSEAYQSLEQKLFDLAERQFTHCLAIATKCGKTSLEAARATKGLGDVALARERQLRAYQLYRQALPLFERHEGSPFRETHGLVSELLRLANLEDEHTELEPLFQKWMELVEKRKLPFDEKLGYKLYNFGLMLHRAGKRDKAEALYERALELYLLRLGRRHVWIPEVLEHLAQLNLEQQDYSAAARWIQELIAVWEERKGRHDMVLVSPLIRFALIRERQAALYGPSPPPDARSLLRRAISICELRQGKMSKELVPALYELARINRQLGLRAVARSLASRAADIAQTLTEKNAPSAAIAPLQLLVEMAREDGQAEKALAIERRMAKIYLATQKIYPLDIIGWFEEIASRLLASTNDDDKELALELYDKTVRRLAGRLGPNDARVTQLREEVARLRTQYGKDR